MGEPIRIAVANDFELVIAGLAAMLQPYDEIVVCDAVLVGEPIPDPLDIVLYDTYGRNDGAPKAVHEFLESGNVDKVVVYTSTPRPGQTAAALDAGAVGVLSKARPAASVVDALKRVNAGERIVDDATGGAQQAPWPGSTLGLTARQSEVVALLLQGMSNVEIAEALVIDVNTVKTHLRHIYRVLGTRSRSQVLARLLPGTEFTRR